MFFKLILNVKQKSPRYITHQELHNMKKLVYQLFYRTLKYLFYTECFFVFRTECFLRKEL